MKYAILLILLGHIYNAHAAPIPTPATCKPEAHQCTYAGGQKCWQRTVDDGTMWRVGGGSTGWIFGHYSGITRLNPGWIWNYSAAPVGNLASLTNCQVVKLINGLRAKLHTNSLGGFVANTTPWVR